MCISTKDRRLEPIDCLRKDIINSEYYVSKEETAETLIRVTRASKRILDGAFLIFQGNNPNSFVQFSRIRTENGQLETYQSLTLDTLGDKAWIKKGPAIYTSLDKMCRVERLNASLPDLIQLGY